MTEHNRYCLRVALVGTLLDRRASVGGTMCKSEEIAELRKG